MHNKANKHKAAKRVLGVLGACVALAAIALSAQGSPADAAVAHRETVASCTDHLVKAIDFGRSEQRVLRLDCSQLTRRDQGWALNDAAQVTS